MEITRIHKQPPSIQSAILNKENISAITSATSAIKKRKISAIMHKTTIMFSYMA